MKKIPKVEWKNVTDMAVVAFERIKNGEFPGDATSDIFEALRKLAASYPFDSRPFSSMGDLSEDVNQSFLLYSKAYNMATHENDYREMVSIASSALRLSMETKRQEEIDRWRNRLLSIRFHARDAWELKEISVLLSGGE